MASSRTIEKQNSIHAEQDRRDQRKKRAPAAKKTAPQTGARAQPTKMPEQHLDADDQESDLELRPRFLAPDYLGSQKLQGQAALITGGDSGIGRSVAILFAREGADVAIAYLASEEDAEETRRCVEAEGRQCLVLQGDVKDPAWCEAAVQETVKTFGKLDVLVNNAAFQKHAESIEDIDDERLKETWDTNLGGYFRMTRAALPHLKEGTCIINTGSVTGLRGSAHLLDYAATKGAIHAFTKSLASNLLPRGIRVNAVAPGPVWTPLNPRDQPAEKVKDFGKKTDFQRAAQPEELSPAYVFLASPCCSGYITGVVLPITGSVDSI
jgi:NAD(P)-dependent dehydrogenase (short-subunit alcohol dehydrogenase family)